MKKDIHLYILPIKGLHFSNERLLYEGSPAKLYHQLIGFRQFQVCKKNKLLDSSIGLHYLNCRQAATHAVPFCFLLSFYKTK